MTNQHEAAALWADWITIWHSEMAALASDREVQEAIQRGADLWAAQVAQLIPEATDEAGSAGALAPQGPAAAPDPPGDPEPAPAQPGPAAAPGD